MFFVPRKLEIHGKPGIHNNQAYFPSCPMFCTTEDSFQPNQAESNFETSENLKFWKVLKSFRTCKKICFECSKSLAGVYKINDIRCTVSAF